jgi:hypothetical protein
MNTSFPKQFVMLSITGFIMIMMLAGCFEEEEEEEEPVNSSVHFTNSTDRDVKIEYYRITNIPFEDSSRKDWLIPGEQKTLLIKGSRKKIEFTIFYNDTKYRREISINSLGDDAQYDITLKSLGLALMANG